MRRRNAGAAEIGRGFDNAIAEVMLPNTVHNHTGSERIIGAGDPVGQSQAAPGRHRGRSSRRNIWLVATKHSEERRWHFGSRRERIAAHENVRRLRLRTTFLHS